MKEKDTGPRIPVQFTDYKGAHIRTIPFNPGMKIRQGDKIYQVDAKGTYRRVDKKR